MGMALTPAGIVIARATTKAISTWVTRRNM
jgi:hypothetical protein